MSDKLVNTDHLRMAAARSRQLSAQVAQSAAEAIEEIAAGAVTMEQVTAAIQAAVNGAPTGDEVPAGAIMMWSGAADAIPSGWSLCDGTNNTPDLRGKFVLGAGGTYNPGSTGGSEEVTLTVEQMPSHCHDYDEGKEGKFKDGTTLYGKTTLQSKLAQGLGTTENAGDGQPHPNMPPYYALCYIMKLAGGSSGNMHTITLTADPPEGGTVSGGGVASDGMVLTVSAEPNEADGYSFDSWKENDAVVSTEPQYKFPVSSNRNLITIFKKIEIPSTLNECTWEQISELSQNGNFGKHFSVGDKKRIFLNGEVGGCVFNNESVDLFVIGIDHNAEIEGTHRVHFKIGLSTGGQAGSGVQISFTDGKYSQYCAVPGYYSMYYGTHSNQGGWLSSQIRNLIMGGNSTPLDPSEKSLMAALPSDLRAVMKSVQKWTDNVGGGVNTPSNVTATTEYLCVPSQFEIFGDIGSANSKEQDYQKQYDYYKAGGSQVHTMFSYNTTKVDTYLRSPAADDENAFCGISKNAYFLETTIASGVSAGITGILFV